MQHMSFACVRLVCLNVSSLENRPTSGTATKAIDFPNDPSTFTSRKGIKWTIVPFLGTNASQNLGPGAIYSNSAHRLGWDKSRTSSLNGTIFRNFGDCLSVDEIINGGSAGFSMGATFCGEISSPLLVDTKGIKSVTDYNFGKPWAGQLDPDPTSSILSYGMDNSNTAQITADGGMAFA